LGLFGRLFGNNTKVNNIKFLVDCLNNLRNGLAIRILAHYKNENDKHTNALVAGAIMNYILCEEPNNEEVRHYFTQNKVFIKQETKNLINNDPSLNYPISMLYLASICLIVEREGIVNHEHIINLISRGADLGVQILTADDLGGIENMNNSFEEYSTKFQLETLVIEQSLFNK
jgi:hypothetical protein